MMAAQNNQRIAHSLKLANESTGGVAGRIPSDALNASSPETVMTTPAIIPVSPGHPWIHACYDDRNCAFNTASGGGGV